MSMSILKLIASSSFLTVNKEIARKIGLDAAILFADLASSQEYWKAKNERWFFRTREVIEGETTLSRGKQIKANKILLGKGLVKTKKMGLPAKSFYLIDEECTNNLINLISDNETASRSKTKQQVELKQNDINKNKVNKNKVNNKDRGVYKETHTQDFLNSEIEKLKQQVLSLKKEKETQEKSSEKKEGHSFPSNEPKKSYKTNTHDKRKAANLPFDLVSARHTLDSIFPTWKELEVEFSKISRMKGNQEVFEKCLTTFVEDGITKYYTGIRSIEKLQVKLFEWVQKEIKFQRNEKPKEKDSVQILKHNEEDPNYFMRRNTWLTN